MKNFIAVLVILFVISSCDEPAGSTVKNGTYSGTFLRSSPVADHQAFNVTISFQNGVFEGSVDPDQDGAGPIICHGTYTASGNKIEFENLCGPWTANFDWSYILWGTFTVSRDGEKLILKRQYDDPNVFDTYELERQ